MDLVQKKNGKLLNLLQYRGNKTTKDDAVLFKN